MRSTTFTILTSILLPTALAAPLNARQENPPICLAVCYFEKPECGELGYPYKWPGDDPANPCWTCCRDSDASEQPGWDWVAKADGVANWHWKPRSDSEETRSDSTETGNKNWKPRSDSQETRSDSTETGNKSWKKRDGNEWGVRDGADGEHEWGKRDEGDGIEWGKRDEGDGIEWTKKSETGADIDWHKRSDDGEIDWTKRSDDDGIEWTKRSDDGEIDWTKRSEAAKESGWNHRKARQPQGDTWVEWTKESQVAKKSPGNDWKARQPQGDDWQGEAAQGKDGWDWKRKAQDDNLETDWH